MMRLATPEQMKMIEKIQSILDVTFEGSTMIDAAKFILKHYDKMKEKENDGI